MFYRHALTALPALLFIQSVALGAIVEEFTDAEEWQAAMASFETIDFVDGNEHFEYIGDDYAESHGVTFTNAYYVQSQSDEVEFYGFISDWLNPGGSGAWVDFETPQYGIAVDHGGDIAFELSYKGEVIFTSGMMGGSGMGHFSGVISSEPFDSVYLHKQFPFEDLEIKVDDLHFGIIPAPGALGLLAFAALLGRSRRRGRC